ncbi:MAG: MAPEG family protein [Myxococcales bacterium]|nr:MAPEG family protein [Myxococcales bacterium]
MNTTAVALVGYIAWMLVLLLILAGLRVYLTFAGKAPKAGFQPDGADVSPFSNRLCRAHANCYEHFPIFGGLMLLALATQQTTVTNGLALWLLGARIGQSTIHLLSTHRRAIELRFFFFVTQVAIALYWAYLFFGVFGKKTATSGVIDIMKGIVRVAC